jgi:hypothetical protein
MWPDGLSCWAVRPITLVAGAVLTTALALVAAPGIAGSRTPAPYEPVPAAAFQELQISANVRSTVSTAGYDPAFDSAGRLTADASFIEPTSGAAATVVVKRDTRQPDPTASKEYKPARYSIHGQATFYDAGYTAMRLPRGTTILVCGGGGCLERVISDYGPIAGTARIIDLYRPDYFAICGCASWSGVTAVTVRVY